MLDNFFDGRLISGREVAEKPLKHAHGVISDGVATLALHSLSLTNPCLAGKDASFLDPTSLGKFHVFVMDEEK